MKKPPYYTIEAMFTHFIEEPMATACLALLNENIELFKRTAGSTTNHQAWEGGFYDHTCEVMNYAILLYQPLDLVRNTPFSLSNALIVLFFHDIEKPWKYEIRADGKRYHRAGMESKEQHQAFRIKKLAEYGIELNEEQENGIKYAEGELNDYSNRKRIMQPLAAFAHMCDVWSARGEYDSPAIENDKWQGAERINTTAG